MQDIPLKDAMILEKGSECSVRWYDYTDGKYPHYRGVKEFKNLEKARRWCERFLEVGVMLVWHPES